MNCTLNPTLLITSPPDAFDVYLYAFRNQDWAPDFQLSDENGNPVDLTGYQLAMIVAPVIFDSDDLGEPVLTNTDFLIDANNGGAVFSFPDPLIAGLSTRGNYRWFLEARLPNATSGSTVITAGPLQILDSPKFPASP